MTVLADIGRRDMGRVLARCVGAVVAADAVARDVHVIEIGRNPGHGRVAVVAIIAARDMSRVLAGCRVAVMTGNAGSEYLGVVYRVCGRKRHIVVAILTHVTRVYMSWVLARCLDAVMAVDTIRGNADVIKVRGDPGDRCVAVIAIVTARDVGRVLAGCRVAVMTGTTGPQHLCVVHPVHRGERHIVMTVLAHVTRVDMIRVLTRCLYAVMAVDTIRGDADVVEVCGRPRHRCMAVVAVVAT